MRRILSLCTLALGLFAASFALAQGTEISFSGIGQNADDPVEIAADSLSVDQDNGTAVFTGNVVIGQGDLRLSAARVGVIYSETGGIDKLDVSGRVTLATETEAVEADRAVYDIKGRTLQLTGDVIFTQGRSALSANTMMINLATNTGRLDGRVRAILQSGNN